MPHEGPQFFKPPIPEPPLEPPEAISVIPPRGFKAEMYPLRHRMEFAFGLSSLQAATNSCTMSLVRNYKTAEKADTIKVNPHHAAFEVETGGICLPMSIIDKLSISMRMTLTEEALTDGMKSATVMYMPIFNSFSEKLASIDDRSTDTAATVLGLISDATEEDVTPITATNLPSAAGVADKNHPLSTANATEAFGHLNLSTNASCEGSVFDNTLYHQAVKYYTNKGAIRSMTGRQRWLTLTDTRPTRSIYIRKFVPRAVRRIMPYAYFGMLVFTPIESDVESPYYSGPITTAKSQIGIKAIINYHEWNADHDQQASTT